MEDVAGVTSRTPDAADIFKTQSGHVFKAGSDSDRLMLLGKLSAKHFGQRSISAPRTVGKLVPGKIGGHTVRQIEDNSKSFRLSYSFTGSEMKIFRGGSTFANRKAQNNT
jgi:hypothetical protein